MACDDRYEREAWGSGFARLAGTDEVGRGALAGPVVAAAVILDPANVPDGLDDSKRIPPARRERLAAEIWASALCCRVAEVSADAIDRTNILRASLAAMRSAIDTLDPRADYVLIDGNVALPDCPYTQRALVGGDGASISIAAASIVAKVARDRLMRDFDQAYPGYGFAQHVGYGTKTHREALARLGPSPIHRTTFRGVLVRAESAP